MKKARFACACCGFLTLEGPPSGTFQVCPVCYWEDDGTQLADPAYDGGANGVSLRRAQENFARFGASDAAVAELVRAPTEDEDP